MTQINYCKNLWSKYAELKGLEGKAEEAITTASQNSDFAITKEVLNSIERALADLQIEFDDSFETLPSGRIIFKADADAMGEFIAKNKLTPYIFSFVKTDNQGHVDNLHLTAMQNIVNIEALAKLPYLKGLQLNQCLGVTDFSPIAKMKRLEIMFLEDTNIDDLNVFLGLDRLVTLVAQGTEIRDLSPLLQMPNLECVYLGRTPALADHRQIEIINQLRTRQPKPMKVHQ